MRFLRSTVLEDSPLEGSSLSLLPISDLPFTVALTLFCVLLCVSDMTPTHDFLTLIQPPRFARDRLAVWVLILEQTVGTSHRDGLLDDSFTCSPSTIKRGAVACKSLSLQHRKKYFSLFVQSERGIRRANAIRHFRQILGITTHKITFPMIVQTSFRLDRLVGFYSPHWDVDAEERTYFEQSYPDKYAQRIAGLVELVRNVGI